MNHLHRELAPIDEAAWDEIEAEARRSLRHFLTARKVVDFSGPHGWDHSALGLGRVAAAADGPADGVESSIRLVQPLAELRTPFTLEREEIDAVERGAPDADMDPVVDAARRAALAEDRLVFRGFAAAGVRGIVETTPHDPVTIDTDYSRYPNYVADRRGDAQARRGRRALRHRAGSPLLHRASSRPPSTAATRCSSTCA